MHVHCDQGLKLGPLHLCQILHCLTDQRVEDVQELVVGVTHDLIKVDIDLQPNKLGTFLSILQLPRACSESRVQII